ISHQIEINDLIDNAVNNALVRRNPDLDTDSNLLDVSNEDAEKVLGGQIRPIISGFISPIPPITVGLIVINDDVLKA
ncbi:hypothetical protein WDZ92_25630, partial [Nostoc sp. NIES-2111]